VGDLDVAATQNGVATQEFCLQGDKEKSMGLEVSPMCDRDAISLCNMQMGFIEFVVAPLIIGEFCLVCFFFCLFFLARIAFSTGRASSQAVLVLPLCTLSVN
jgi:hypothetical protein